MKTGSDWKVLMIVPLLTGMMVLALPLIRVLRGIFAQ
jgi:hypothetical protein